MAQYPVPQFIEKEGRIIFFLTFKQFFELASGGAVCILLYFTLPFFFFLIGSIFVMLLVIAIAFLKINDTSIVTIFLNLISYLIKTKNYIWRKKESSYPFKIKGAQQIKSMPEPAGLKPQASKIKEVKKTVELKI